MTIRDATIDDVPAITGLYNALIPTTTVAWTESLQTTDERAHWLTRQWESGFPVLVHLSDPANGGAAEVVGFAAYGHFRGAGMWPGYRFTVEHTIHIREDQWGRSVGRVLLEALMTRARTNGMHVMVGAVDGANTASIEFHRRMGFTEVGRMPEVGRKFDRWLDLVLMQRILDGGDPQ